MKVKVLFTGKTTEAWVRQGIEQYAARIRHYVSFELVELPDLKQTASLSEEQIDVFHKILDCVSDTAVAEMRAAYKVGFKDGVALIREVQNE